MPADELSVELDYARDVSDDVRKIDRITHQLQWLAAFIKRWEKVTRQGCAPEPGFASGRRKSQFLIR